MTFIKPIEFYEYLILKHKPEATKINMTQKELFLNNSIIYYNNEKTFLFLGFSHQRLSEETIDAFSSLLKHFVPQTVLFEFDESIPIDKVGKFSTRVDEIGIGVRLSFLLNSQIRGIDLPKTEFLKIFSDYDKKNYKGIELGVYWNFVNIYRYFKKIMENNKNEEVFEKVSQILEWEFLNEKGSLYSYKNEFLELIKKYSIDIKEGFKRFIEEQNIKNTGKQFSEIKDYDQLTVPFPYCTKYPINRASTYLEAHRNVHIIENIFKELEKNNCVASIIGTGHVSECKDILSDMLYKKFGMQMKRLSELK
ncbi:MAG: hypothetical protein QXL94_01425 [Candidatus Parvarchaeum sp.]